MGTGLLNPNRRICNKSPPPRGGWGQSSLTISRCLGMGAGMPYLVTFPPPSKRWALVWWEKKNHLFLGNYSKYPLLWKVWTGTLHYE